DLEYIRTFVNQLRKKIEDDPAHPAYLVTQPFIGYRFRLPEPEVDAIDR
ncbi:MAG: kdpE, partial [Bryobacterales bacterium]|nr:kdpE [Bryobacterales bacterium]